MRSKNLGLQIMRSILQLKGIRGSSCMMIQCPSGGGIKTTATATATSMTIKVIRSDGVVNIYEKPIQVSELMVEFPKHMVCSSDSFYIGQKIPPLSEHDHLLPGHSYFLLPSHLFQSVLSFVTITSFLASSQSQSHSHLKKALLSCQPFHIHKTPSGFLRVNVSEEFISQLMIMEMEQELGNNTPGLGRVCSTRQLQKDYAQLAAPRPWKPKLETIKETREKRRKFACRKNSHKSSLHSSSNNTQKTQKSTSFLQHSSSQVSPSPPKQSKIKTESTPKSIALTHHHHHHNKIKAFLTTNRKGRRRMI